MKSNQLGRRALAAAVFSALSAAGIAQTAPATTDSSGEEATANSGGLAEVVVTAQKRQQSINDVGLTIQAATAQDLQNLGIESPADLPKLVPGLTFTQSIFSTPVYTLRGVGLYDATWGAVPAVAVYTDQVPRDFPIMSDALDLDLQRIEVLKGPQGTLFGQSSTGGAVNYILNKPTDTFQANASASVERFDKTKVSAAISGPINDTLRARFAMQAIEGGAWQYSVSRPYDQNGATRLLEGRFTVDWDPIENLKTEASFTAVQDHSDPQAPQFVYTLLNVYSSSALAAANANPKTANPYGVVNNSLYNALTNPSSPAYSTSFLGQQSAVVGWLHNTDPTYAQQSAAAAQYLGATDPAPNSRAADWTPGLIGASGNSYFQGTLRGDYKFVDDLTLTSLTAFAHKKISYGQDLDATPASVGDVPLWGSVRAFNQELHLSGNPGNLNWIVGADYDDSHTTQNNYYDLRDYASNAFGLIPCTYTASFNPTACQSGTYGGPYSYINITENNFESQLKSYAGFGNVDYKFTNNLSANAGLRFTKTDQKATYCYNDPSIDLNEGTDFIFSFLEENPTAAKGGPLIKPGQCFPLGDGNLGTTKGLPTLSPLTPPALDEHNVSYRVGLDYKLDQGTLFYATVSQGYKAGLFSEIGASTTSQYTPAAQEKLVDYELGFKAPLLEHRLELNGAVFDYDYSNKQVRGRVLDPVYGLLEKVINVPKSRVQGAELDIEAVPFEGLHLTIAGTWLHSEVTSNFSEQDGVAIYNAEGYSGNFKDATLPFTPDLSGTADAQYDFPLFGSVVPFVGTTFVYQTKENTTFQNASLPAPDFEIPSYGTLDVRAGIRSSDNKWDVMAYGHNITSKYYVTAISFYLDSFERFTGQPAIYGVTVHVNF